MKILTEEQLEQFDRNLFLLGNAFIHCYLDEDGGMVVRVIPNEEVQIIPKDRSCPH